MFHSIDFHKTVNGVRLERNTWNDWHLIPSARPDVSLPTRRTNYVAIPGMDGQLDLSEYLTGRINYEDRTGSWEFIVVQEYDGKVVDSRDWNTRQNEIMAFLDGSKIALILEDVPGYFYQGRAYVDVGGWKTGASFSTITISYKLQPYKYDVNSGVEAGF